MWRYDNLTQYMLDANTAICSKINIQRRITYTNDNMAPSMTSLKYHTWCIKQTSRNMREKRREKSKRARETRSEINTD